MSHTTSHTKLLRRLLVWFGLAVCVVVLGSQIVRLRSSATLPVDDFVEYWAAGRLNLYSGNPYAPDQLLSLQRTVGWPKNQPLMMWNPPWVLALVMPFALPDYSVGRLLWFGLQVSIVLLCADWVWRIYGGSRQRRWWAWLIAFTFLPTLFVLKIGQISSLILLGVVGFLYFEQRKRWLLAGAFLALVAVKPQLLYLLWVAIVLWSFDRRHWGIMVGGGLAGLALTGVAFVFNQAVISQYLWVSENASPFFWATPTWGAVLCIFWGIERSWLQFLSPLLGTTWFFFYWRQHRQAWQWLQQMPLLLLVSLATTAFGWPYDQVVLLVPLLQMAVWLATCGLRRIIMPAFIGYLLIEGLALALNLLDGSSVTAGLSGTTSSSQDKWVWARSG